MKNVHMDEIQNIRDTNSNLASLFCWFLVILAQMYYDTMTEFVCLAMKFVFWLLQKLSKKFNEWVK